MVRKKINTFIYLALILVYPISTYADGKKSELELILESLNGTPTPTPVIKDDYEKIKDEIEAQHQRSVEISEIRKKQEQERKLAEARMTPTPDPFLERMTKRLSALNDLNRKNNEILKQASRQLNDLSRQKNTFENQIKQKNKNEFLTNSDINWINSLVRSLEFKYNSSTNTLSNYIKALEVNSNQLNDWISLSRNLENGISDDVASDRQKLANCDYNMTKMERAIQSINAEILRINLENEYKTNLAAIDKTIKRRETEYRQKNYFKK